MLRAELLFRWYDFWIGLYWDREQRVLYVFPFPMFGCAVWRDEGEQEREARDG